MWEQKQIVNYHSMKSFERRRMPSATGGRSVVIIFLLKLFMESDAWNSTFMNRKHKYLCIRARVLHLVHFLSSTISGLSVHLCNQCADECILQFKELLREYSLHHKQPHLTGLM